jgi:hypothetical protein
MISAYGVLPPPLLFFSLLPPSSTLNPSPVLTFVLQSKVNRLAEFLQFATVQRKSRGATPSQQRWRDFHRAPHGSVVPHFDWFDQDYSTQGFNCSVEVCIVFHPSVTTQQRLSLGLASHGFYRAKLGKKKRKKKGSGQVGRFARFPETELNRLLVRKSC